MVKEELTEMQKRFCDYYIESPVGVHAAIRAGYKEHSARTRASQLLAMPKVQDYIIERNSDLEDIRIADMKEVRMFWTRVMRDEEEETSERLRASDFIAKSNGAYLERVQQSGGLDLEIRWAEDG